MKFKPACTIALLISGLLPAALLAQTQAPQQDTQQALEQSTRRAQQRQLYDLRYKVTVGEELRWEVEQIAKTKVSMSGFDEESSLRSRSVIRWTVDSVEENGDFTFTENAEIPDVYESTAERVGKPISTTTINDRGGVIKKEEHIKSAEFGMGRITPPFPPEPVAIGTQWHIPDELKARHADNSLNLIGGHPAIDQFPLEVEFLAVAGELPDLMSD